LRFGGACAASFLLPRAEAGSFSTNVWEGRSRRAPAVNAAFGWGQAFPAQHLDNIFGGATVDVGLLAQCQPPAGTVGENSQMLSDQRLQGRITFGGVLARLAEKAFVDRQFDFLLHDHTQSL
jgi:hypothetical protein